MQQLSQKKRGLLLELFLNFILFKYNLKYSFIYIFFVSSSVNICHLIIKCYIKTNTERILDKVISRFISDIKFFISRNKCLYINTIFTVYK